MCQALLIARHVRRLGIMAQTPPGGEPRSGSCNEARQVRRLHGLLAATYRKLSSASAVVTGTMMIVRKIQRTRDSCDGGSKRALIGALHALTVMITRAKKTASAWGGLRPAVGALLKCAGSNRHDFGSRQTAPSLQRGARDGAAGGGMQITLD